MSAVRTLRGRLAVIAVAAAALLVAPMATAPAYADQPVSVAKYVALGDSYAAGQGAGAPLDACMHAALGYPALLDSVPRINLLRDPSCTRATIADVEQTQLASINRGTTLVTISAGANDLGLSTIYDACAADPASPGCAAAVAGAMAALGGIEAKAATLIADAHARSPHATIVVTGYVVPFSPALAALPLPPAYQQLIAEVNQGVAALNAQLTMAVALSASAGAPALFAAPDFTGHRIGDADPWLGADPSSPSFLHPTADGYVAYRDAILAVLDR